ncbi:hypothetical protein N7533_008321, partial [Penicillium manginii]|uniref:uncharacterized protein n=1 Tax=Penicillium manginii TaxID=203109 RepID=UPI0025475A2C
ELSVPQPKARTPKSPTKLNGNGNNRLAHHTDPKDVALVVAKTIEESVDWVFSYCEK